MIDTAALQSKIIDLAIQGKLTEQLPTDGNAEDLYQQIQAEKAQLIKDKKIKKEKPLPEITADEIPFDVPDNWKWVRLGEIASKISSGNTPPGGKKSDAYVKEGYSFFREQNIYNDGIRSEGLVYISGELLEKRPNSTVLPKDILLNITGGSIGRCAIVPDDFTKGSINQHILIIRMINPEFRAYVHNYICSEQGQKYIKGNAIGDKDGFSGGRCKNMPIPLPPLSEQKRIVAKIDEVLTEIKIIDEVQSQYASNVDALKSKIIDAGIRGQLTEQLPEDGTAEELYQQIQAEKAQLIKDNKIKKEKPLPEITADEIPFDVPDNWKWVRWGDISQSIQYGYNAPALENGRIKMVRISDIQSNEVLWEDVPYCDIDEDSIETYLLQPNDILFARTGGTVGKSYLVEEVPEEAVYAGYLIRTRYSSLLSPRYLKYFMQGSLYWSQLRNGTIATAQPNCNGKTLGKMIVPLPPLSEQKRIVAKINDVFGALDERDRL